MLFAYSLLAVSILPLDVNSFLTKPPLGNALFLELSHFEINSVYRFIVGNFLCKCRPARYRDVTFDFRSNEPFIPI